MLLWRIFYDLGKNKPYDTKWKYWKVWHVIWSYDEETYKDHQVCQI